MHIDGFDLSSSIHISLLTRIMLCLVNIIQCGDIRQGLQQHFGELSFPSFLHTQTHKYISV